MRIPRPSSTQLGAGVLIVAALAVGRLIADITPESEAGSKPFTRTAAIGEELQLRYGDITVTKVEGGPQLSRISQGYVSPGLWLVVTLKVAPREDARTPAFAQLRGGDGTVINTGGRNEFQCEPANPGITVRCGASFEVAPESLPGAHLEVALDKTQDQRFDDLARIDLGIEDRDVSAWRTRTQQIVFPLEETTGGDG